MTSVTVPSINDSFAVSDSNSFMSPLKVFPRAQENKYLKIFRDIFIFYHETVCCVFSLELPHYGDSNEYTNIPLFIEDYKIS